MDLIKTLKCMECGRWLAAGYKHECDQNDLRNYYVEITTERLANVLFIDPKGEEAQEIVLALTQCWNWAQHVNQK